MMTPAEFHAKTLQDPEWFLREVLNVQYWQAQLEMIERVRENQRVSISGCTSSTKTYGAGFAFLWWLFAYGAPARVITFAPTGRQVRMNLWGYAKSIYRQSKIKLGGEFLTTDYKLSDDWYATGFSTDEAEKARGIHGKRDLIILDDAQGIMKSMFVALENAMASGSAHLLLLFNKSALSGGAYDSCHSKRHLYSYMSIPAADTPNWKAGKALFESIQAANPDLTEDQVMTLYKSRKEEAVVIEGMITFDQAEEWKKTEGEDSDFYRTMVLDLFPRQGPRTLIPQDWIELAMKREASTKGDMDLGADIAGPGKDKTVTVPMKGRKVFMPRISPRKRTTENTGLIIKDFTDLNAHTVFVDDNGIGYGVWSELKEAGINAVGVNAGSGSDVPRIPDMPEKGKKFANLRAEIWWTIREALDPDGEEPIQLPNSPRLAAQLSSINFTYNSKGEILIEAKESMRKRLGESPDEADGLGLVVWGKKKKALEGDARYVTVYEFGEDD